MPNDMAKSVKNNHNELNLGQILFMLPTEIKIKIRKLEKAHNVFINNKYGIIFNETCIKEGLLPKYTNISIYIYIYITLKQTQSICNINNFNERTVLFLNNNVSCAIA